MNEVRVHFAARGQRIQVQVSGHDHLVRVGEEFFRIELIDAHRGQHGLEKLPGSFDYVPGEGTRVYADDELLFQTGDKKLIGAVSEMLLGPDPVSADLREELVEELRMPGPTAP